MDTFYGGQQKHSEHRRNWKTQGNAFIKYSVLSKFCDIAILGVKLFNLLMSPVGLSGASDFDNNKIQKKKTEQVREDFKDCDLKIGGKISKLKKKISGNSRGIKKQVKDISLPTTSLRVLAGQSRGSQSVLPITRNISSDLNYHPARHPGFRQQKVRARVILLQTVMPFWMLSLLDTDTKSLVLSLASGYALYTAVKLLMY